MKKYKTLVTGKVPVEWTGDLINISDVHIWGAEGNYLMPPDRLKKLIHDADAIVNFAELRINDSLLNLAPGLKIVANASIGYDNLDLDALTRRGIWASNSPGYFNYAVAEYIISGMLYISRRVGECQAFVREGKWAAFEPGRWDGVSLREQTLGIIGMGAIGKELANFATCLGMRVHYFDPFNDSYPGFLPLEALLRQSDFISVNVPLTIDTFHLANRMFFEKMKPGAVFMNTSRGAVVDEAVLIEFLEKGKLRGAVLDVFENEPLVPESLRKMNNVVLTPHVGGGTRSSRKSCLENAFLNVFEALTGKKPHNALNNIS